LPSRAIPKPAIKRLAALYPLLGGLLTQGETSGTSQEMGSLLGVPAHTVRKDLSYLPDKPATPGAYQLQELREIIGRALKLEEKQQACIVGLGDLGQAILNFPNLLGEGYHLAAGFDTNINRLEILKTPLPLYPAYEIPDILPAKGIKLGILAVDAPNVDKTLERLIQGGIKGILNLSPRILPDQVEQVEIRNIFLAGELNLLTGLINCRPDPLQD